MIKGYLTVFLSLSLSILIGFALFLTAGAIKNAGKVRLEIASDIGMNSVLAEFHKVLHDRYDLLYVDISYLNKEPDISNMESRLYFYLKMNMDSYAEDEPWGDVDLKEVKITEIITAAEGNGNSMKHQAVKYIQDSKIQRKETDIYGYLETAAGLDDRNVMEEWSTLQEVIAGIELPQVKNQKGEWEEVPLGNPADRIFCMAGSDPLYLLKRNPDNISIGNIQREKYISGRQTENITKAKGTPIDDQLFLTYLFEKMGCCRNIKEDSLLQYQLEYIIWGGTSDYENLQAVAERLIGWRLAVNVDYVMGNASMYEEAATLAEALYAVQLKTELKEPVTQSILYAYAYLETIAEVYCLFEGGYVETEKSRWQTNIEQVLSGEICYESEGWGELSYEQCLACMLLLLPEDVRNLRSMDIMEMDIRYLTGNPYFSMDWCVERYRAQIIAENIFRESYMLNRTYGYY